MGMTMIILSLSCIMSYIVLTVINNAYVKGPTFFCGYHWLYPIQDWNKFNRDVCHLAIAFSKSNIYH